MIQPERSPCCSGSRDMQGAQWFPARRLPARQAALLPIAGACSPSFCSAADAARPGRRRRLRGRGRTRGAALAGRAVEGRAAARRVRRGEAARRRAVADRARRQRSRRSSRERHGGPPYFWIAEVASPAAGTWRATLTRDRAPAECGTITREIAVRADRPPRAGRGAGKRLAAARHLESRDRKPVLRLDREAVRRSARRRAVVAGAA